MNKWIVLSVAVAICGSAQAQEALTPRDSFWSASDLVEVAPNPATQPPAKIKQTAETKPKQSTRVSGQATPLKQKAVQVAAKGYGAEPHIVQLKASQQRLGLRYALLKVGDAGELSEVLPETTFHSGDKLKISLMANQPGYIYIIQQGSSGNWRPLFPSPGDLPESNRVEAGRIYQIPSGKSFQFNQQTGQERLFILLSRQVVSDLDGVIFNLRQQEKDPTATSRPSEQVEASNRISDQLIKNLQSRDLMEVVDPPQETKNSSLGENAVYVVSQGKSNSTASQVFANLVLDHQ
ncbi:MAG TPA: DUF4384 domain-containing protein [Acidobacteriaceae bacterium]|nr:DUF4384 domain-containing protein [Acidobacteriaceae bacterium]